VSGPKQNEKVRVTAMLEKWAEGCGGLQVAQDSQVACSCEHLKKLLTPYDVENMTSSATDCQLVRKNPVRLKLFVQYIIMYLYIHICT
jgi:hypothetical protein